MAVENTVDVANMIPTDVQLYQPDKFPVSYSGLGTNYIEQIMSAVMPQFQSSVGDYMGNIDQYVTQAQDGIVSMGTDMLGPLLQSQLNSLAGRGMVNSKVASTSMGAATGEVMKNISNQAFQVGMEGAKMKMGAPDMLGQLMSNLGKYSEAKDPSIPERTLAALFTGVI